MDDADDEDGDKDDGGDDASIDVDAAAYEDASDSNEHGSYSMGGKERRRAAHEARRRALKDRRSAYRTSGRKLQESEHSRHSKKSRRHHHHHDYSPVAKCYHHTPRDGRSPLAAFRAKCSVDE